MKRTVLVCISLFAWLACAVNRTAPGGESVGTGESAKGGTPPARPVDPDFVGEADLPEGSLAGLTDEQKAVALKALNTMSCDCGCVAHSIARCRREDPYCPKAPTSIERAVALAKAGKNEDAIKRALARGRPEPSGESAAVYKVPVEDSYCQGPKTAKVTILESMDFQCPFSGRAVATVTELQQRYGSNLRLCVRHNPLSFHTHAADAAEAALAAGEQGKYWEMHARLFANQQALDRESLKTYASEIGLELPRFEAALNDSKFRAGILRDQRLVEALGASGTPVFFINGRKLSGAQPIDRFTALIDQGLLDADDLLRSGVHADEVYATLVKDGLTSAPPARKAPSEPPAPTETTRVDVAAFNPIRGPKAAKVTIVEFTDFQCPFCARVIPTLKQIQQTYGNDVRLVFRNNPLPFHAYAELAAEAALAADAQGRFWEMHDALFDAQGKIDAQNPMPDLERIAGEVGLVLKPFKSAMESHRFKPQVAEDMNYASAVDALGTPIFFVNGHKVSGAQPFDTFKKVIDEEIKNADELLAKGVKLDDLYAAVMKGAKSPPPRPKPAANREFKRVEIAAFNPVRGSKKPKVTIVEFADFQCPFCRRAQATMKQIEEKYGKDVRFVFRNQPLPFHTFAMPAAEAAMAAHEQGRFWPMYDKLFDQQQEIDRENPEAALRRIAEGIGLNMRLFDAALQTPKLKAQIEEDRSYAASVGANGTPTFFVNGRIIVGAQPFDSFATVIDEEIQAADDLLKKGVRPDKLYEKLLERHGDPASDRADDAPRD